MRLRAGLAVLLLLTACSSSSNPVIGISAAGDASSQADGQIGDGASADLVGTSDTAATDDTGADGQAADAAPGDVQVTDMTGSDAQGSDAQAPDAVADGLTSDGSVAKYAACSTLFYCSQLACFPDFAAGCEQTCTGAATPAAAAQIAPVFACVDQLCRSGLCEGASDPKCVSDCAYKRCGYKMVECTSDGAKGNAGCDSVFTCIAGCKDDIKCQGACFGAMNANGQAEFEALMSCASAAGGTDPFKACPGQALKCAAGGKTGAAGCMDTLGCFESCPKNDTGNCGGICFGKATAEAQKQVIVAAKCFDNNTDPSCAGALASCIDPKGSKNCVDTIGCLEKCGKSNDACNMVCFQAASKAELQKFLALFQCSDAACKAKCAGNQSCEGVCSKQACPAQWNACLGG